MIDVNPLRDAILAVHHLPTVNEITCATVQARFVISDLPIHSPRQGCNFLIRLPAF